MACVISRLQVSYAPTAQFCLIHGCKISANVRYFIKFLSAVLSSKLGFDQPFDIHFYVEQIASQGLLFPFLFFKTPRSGCDKEFIQVFASKCKRDDILYRETNLALDLAIRVITGELPPALMPIPDKALRVYDQPIGLPFILRDASKDATITGRPFIWIIVQS